MKPTAKVLMLAAAPELLQGVARAKDPLRCT